MPALTVSRTLLPASLYPVSDAAAAAGSRQDRVDEGAGDFPEVMTGGRGNVPQRALPVSTASPCTVDQMRYSIPGRRRLRTSAWASSSSPARAGPGAGVLRRAGHRSRRLRGGSITGPRQVPRISAVIGVAPVVDVQDMDLLGVVVDGVPDPVLAAPGPPVALERRAQRCSDPVRLLRQRASDELVAGPGDSLRESLLQLAGGRGGHDDLVGHASCLPKRSAISCST